MTQHKTLAMTAGGRNIGMEFVPEYSPASRDPVPSSAFQRLPPNVHRDSCQSRCQVNRAQPACVRFNHVGGLQGAGTGAVLLVVLYTPFWPERTAAVESAEGGRRWIAQLSGALSW